jgi:hypothetical protein
MAAEKMSEREKLMTIVQVAQGNYSRFLKLRS